MKDGKAVGQKSLAEASSEVEADLRREREQEAQQKMLQDLMMAGDVKIFGDLFPGSSQPKGGGAKAK